MLQRQRHGEDTAEGRVGAGRALCAEATAVIASTAMVVRYMSRRWVSWMSTSRPY